MKMRLSIKKKSYNSNFLNLTFEELNNPNIPVLFFDFPPLTVWRTLPFSRFKFFGVVVNVFPLRPSGTCELLKSSNAMSEGIG